MKDFAFQTPVVQIDEVKQNIIQVFNGFRALIGTEKISRVVMQLSIADLQCLGQKFGAQILSNTAIMVQK